MTLRAVLLDMGGVLLSMSGSRGFPRDRLDWRGRQALVRWIRDRGGRIALEDLESLVFGPWKREYDRRYERGVEASWGHHLDRLRKAARLEASDLDLLRPWFRPYGEQLSPCEGAGESLQRLCDRDLRLALVSNVPLPGALYREVLDRFDLIRHLADLRFSYDEGSRKPSPMMLRRAIRKFGLGPEQAMMVGDRRANDVAAGRAAGMATIWVRGDEDGGPEGDFTIDSIVELPGLIADHFD